MIPPFYGIGRIGSKIQIVALPTFFMLSRNVKNQFASGEMSAVISCDEMLKNRLLA